MAVDYIRFYEGVTLERSSGVPATIYNYLCDIPIADMLRTDSFVGGQCPQRAGTSVQTSHWSDDGVGVLTFDPLEFPEAAAIGSVSIVQKSTNDGSAKLLRAWDLIAGGVATGGAAPLTIEELIVEDET